MRKILLFLVVFFYLNIVNAQMHKFQAAYIYNISKHMEWPIEYKKGNFVIAVFSKDPIINELKKIAASKKYLNRKIEVKVFKSTAEITKCHILFVPTKQTSLMKSILSKTNKYKTLLITNKKGAIKLGSGINFLLIGGKLKFEIKKSNITKKKIKVSSTIEKLAVKKY